MRVLLADQEMLFRDGIAAMIEGSDQNMHFVAVADYEEAMETLRNDEPYDAIIMDSRLNGMNVCDVISNIGVVASAANLAIISSSFTRDQVLELTRRGGISLIPKTLSAAQFIEVIKFISNGGLYQPFEIIKLVTEEFSDLPAPQLKKMPLTPRECDVLSQLGEGHSNKQIASNLNIQDVTVRLHLRGIFRKLNAKNRVHAVLRAIELGLLPHLASASTRSDGPTLEFIPGAEVDHQRDLFDAIS